MKKKAKKENCYLREEKWINIIKGNSMQCNKIIISNEPLWQNHEEEKNERNFCPLSLTKKEHAIKFQMGF
jgi:hypothetical protein